MISSSRPSKTSAKMASTLHSNLTFLPPNHKPTITKSITTHSITIRCGPRSNRGPLVKGRILSTEAIQAVQSLKRAHKSNPDNPTYPSLSRLIKADLLAALRELIRQGECALAVHVFSTFQREYPQRDLSLLGDLVSALAKKGMTEEIDRLMGELEINEGDEKGLLRVIKAVVGAGSKESTVRIYGVMKRSGVGYSWKVDEYVGKVLSKGLRRFGEEEMASEVEREFCWVHRGSLEKLIV
ncbi:Pentatricopeptide repeat-containing protein [Melia azedarach]|uniref:Pentatricopeptide repeat-containing protein n=1 Tax=Melia azedarach TaxID=155640 RepID=A0ACC1Y2Y2_MELAZ|nr:Pentatricopeptide repeat-containing protein [Melia azedarach]